MTALRQALIDACVTEGWAWNAGSEVLSKDAMFLRLQIVSGYLTLLGRTSATAGDMPNVVRIGQLGTQPLVWPLSYEIFVFNGEVYLVANYNVDFYQWCAFGLSTVDGLPGSGMWVGATVGSGVNPTGGPIYIMGGAGGDPGDNSTSGALFWATVTGSGGGRNGFVHSDLDAQGWWLGQYLTDYPVGIAPIVPLIGLLPNAWNSEAVLLPIRSYKKRPELKVSLITDLEHARYTRVDNYEPSEIITIGSDRWKVYPWYRKNTTTRNGGSGIAHTGTFGWAIRYEGP
ncbi:hypothetical protein FHR87_002200 [Azomonas macrocytogenes]|uniref:Virion structural protein n=2 Tax=Azomonas macrocytogenes TaxID=69962 RepID=A0A839T816_AZOMA|nr:hypothetical protein [Azomonas macrocytogenes]